jgi:hypothetical protein
VGWDWPAVSCERCCGVHSLTQWFLATLVRAKVLNMVKVYPLMSETMSCSGNSRGCSSMTVLRVNVCTTLPVSSHGATQVQRVFAITHWKNSEP